jgi:hypothetical protein
MTLHLFFFTQDLASFFLPYSQKWRNRMPVLDYRTTIILPNWQGTVKIEPLVRIESNVIILSISILCFLPGPLWHGRVIVLNVIHCRRPVYSMLGALPFVKQLCKSGLEK